MSFPSREVWLQEYADHGVAGLEGLLDGASLEGADIDAWIDEIPNADACVAATWLLRTFLRGGGELERGRTARVIRLLAKVQDDNARLHLCQSVGALEIPPRSAEPLARFLRAGAAGEHKLVRAWAVDGLWRLARQHRRYHAEASAWLERAARDPAASVRARARGVAKERGRDR